MPRASKVYSGGAVYHRRAGDREDSTHLHAPERSITVGWIGGGRVHPPCGHHGMAEKPSGEANHAVSRMSWRKAANC